MAPRQKAVQKKPAKANRIKKPAKANRIKKDKKNKKDKKAATMATTDKQDKATKGDNSKNVLPKTMHTVKDWPLVQYDQGWRGELCGLSWSQPDGKVSERWRWTSPSPKAKAKA